MAKKIDVEVRNNVATIKLTDSKNLNPLNKETGKALFEALENLKDNSEVRCVIITGSGRAFSIRRKKCFL